jgi:hypothetical protein
VCLLKIFRIDSGKFKCGVTETSLAKSPRQSFRSTVVAEPDCSLYNMQVSEGLILGGLYPWKSRRRFGSQQDACANKDSKVSKIRLAHCCPGHR